jgi:hypothetical protein
VRSLACAWRCAADESDNVVLSMNGLRTTSVSRGRRRAITRWRFLLPAGRRATEVALLGLLLTVSSLLAQQTAPSTSAPLTSAPPASAPAQPPTPAQPSAAGQQPGQGAEVHTGTRSGLDTDIRLQNLLADHEYFRVEADLSQLTPDQAQFYRGVLANRSNDLTTSIQLLEPLVDAVTASGNTAHEKLLREALAEDYLREGNLAKAAQAYQALDARLHNKLTPDELDEIEMPLKLLPLAKDDPPMTVEPSNPFQLQASKDPLGFIDIPVFVDARPHSWMLDPTAPFNLIDRSTAREVGLKVSDDFATIHTLTGRPIQVHVAVIPRFTIGGRLTLRDVTVFVYDDADYYFPRSRYQVEGVLGYPALSALGSLTVTDDDTILVRPAKQIDPLEKDDLLTRGAPFFLDGDQILVALTRTPAGSTPSASGDSGSKVFGANPANPDEERMYVVDEGSQQTYLTSRYFDEHTVEFAGKQMSLYAFPGQQPAPPQPSLVAETVPFTVGQNTFNLHYIRVLTQPLGSAALDDVYGVLGIDALEQLLSYTFDYRTMRFSVQPEP